MGRRLAGLWGLVLLVGCGVDEEPMRLREGVRFADFTGCFSTGECPDPNARCVFLFNVEGEVDRTPPLCVPLPLCGEGGPLVCERGECRIFQTFPFEVKCVEP